MESLLAACCHGGEPSCVAGAAPVLAEHPTFSPSRSGRVAEPKGLAEDSCRDSLIRYTTVSRVSFPRSPSQGAAPAPPALVAAQPSHRVRPVWSPVWRHGGPPIPLDFRTALLI